MLEATKNFIIRIQNSEERVRRRWLVIATSSTMALVIGLWLIYINFITKPLEATTLQQATLPTQPGLAQIFGIGFKIVADQITKSASQTINYLEHTIGAPKIINIDNAKNFTAEDLPKIPSTRLP